MSWKQQTKQVGMAVVIINKIDFKRRHVTREKEGYCMIKSQPIRMIE